MTVYDKLLQRCSDRDWSVELAHGKRGWQLQVFDGEELLARSRSTADPPGVYDRLAAAASIALGKSNRA